jgi:hypothetical protein
LNEKLVELSHELRRSQEALQCSIAECQAAEQARDEAIQERDSFSVDAKQVKKTQLADRESLKKVRNKLEHLQERQNETDHKDQDDLFANLLSDSL